MACSWSGPLGGLWLWSWVVVLVVVVEVSAYALRIHTSAQRVCTVRYTQVLQGHSQSSFPFRIHPLLRRNNSLTTHSLTSPSLLLNTIPTPSPYYRYDLRPSRNPVGSATDPYPPCADRDSQDLRHAQPRPNSRTCARIPASRLSLSHLQTGGSHKALNRREQHYGLMANLASSR